MVSPSVVLQLVEIVGEIRERIVQMRRPMRPLPISPSLFGHCDMSLVQSSTLGVPEQLDPNQVRDIGSIEITDPHTKLSQVWWIVLCGKSSGHPDSDIHFLR
jgi:hypothetical protein